jgi:hypothetical protein
VEARLQTLKELGGSAYETLPEMVDGVLATGDVTRIQALEEFVRSINEVRREA